MSSIKIKKGDTVKVIAGKDKNKEGKVIAVDVKKHKVLVEGVGMITKHTKPSAANQQGGIINQESYIDASNVMYLHKGKVTRIGFQGVGKEKVRVAKATGDVIK
jgi:ribosomal protein L24, bacterial/organelle